MLETLGELARRAFGDVRIRTASTLGIEALAHFRREFPLVRVLVVSALEDRACVMAALEAGAAGYLPKTSRLLTMLAAVRLVGQGGTYIPPETFARDAFTPTGLTEREIDVLRLLAQGRNDKHIAYALGIAEGSARQHVKEVFRTLGASSRGEAVVIAARCGVRLD